MKRVKPNDSMWAIVPYITPKRCDSEFSCKVDIDITNLCDFVDKLNESGTNCIVLTIGTIREENGKKNC